MPTDSRDGATARPDTPEIVRQHECPESTRHYNQAPWTECMCRICQMARKYKAAVSSHNAVRALADEKKAHAKRLRNVGWDIAAAAVENFADELLRALGDGR